MFRLSTEFRDRRDAGQHLAKALLHLAGNDPLVLALPRGGVPVAYEVARALAAPLDLLLVRKIGAPHHPELGLGAVVDGSDPQLVLNEEVMRAVTPDPTFLEAEQRRQLAEIERRRELYRGARSTPEVKGRTVILVDDGIATGGTVKAALRGLARSEPARLVLAIPVAPSDSLDELRVLVDELVCLLAPDVFFAVGAYYGDFTQTTDEEVIHLLDEAQHWSAEGGARQAHNG